MVYCSYFKSHSDAGKLGPYRTLYENERKLDAIKQDALYSYRRYLDNEFHFYYPPADPEELKAAKAVQKSKREIRRTRVNEGGNLVDAIVEEIGGFQLDE